MEVARNSVSARRWVLVALVALIGLAVVAVGSSPAASGSGRAVAAKKCKKHKRSAAAAKKKKCKKVHHVVLPAPGPLVRGTLSWSATNEVDLHAFDANGAHAGWNGSLNGVENLIPNATHNGDIGPGGPSESFTDNIFQMGGPSNREFSYVACLYGKSGPDPSYTATFTGVASNGQSTSVSVSYTSGDGADATSLTVPGGPPIPGNPC
jgi:hypothetical protein